VSRNLAVALGESHHGRVVLVDANLRSPSQADAFHIDAPRGLADVLNGAVAVADALCEVPEAGIALLSSGSPLDIPPHLITMSALQGVVTGLQSQFDWVIVDGPAVTTYPDAATIGSVADGTILVVRAERTRSEVAEKAMKVLHDSGAALLGGVLTGRRYHIPEFIYRRL
jgi:Mrp family chromosome partitioning ATPase